ncbi:MAG: hypothetical protein ACI8PZ_002544 [Myxococcota bacterium]|jgi:hypothetical protein
MLTSVKGPREQLVWRREMTLGGGGRRDRAEIEAAALAQIKDVRDCYRRPPRRIRTSQVG